MKKVIILFVALILLTGCKECEKCTPCEKCETETKVTHEELKKEQLMKIEGGMSTWAAIGIGAGIVFLIGVLDGFFRPLKCN